MWTSLKRHPDSRGDAVTRVEIMASRMGKRILMLRYVISGDVSKVLLPPEGPPDRADELWKHTCFEAFLRGPDGEAYCEINLSPSRQWAAYSFTGYRQGMAPLEPIKAPRSDLVDGRPKDWEIMTFLRDFEPPPLPEHKPWRLAMTAIIEETDGAKSYWSLAHPPGKPDFHHAANFAGELPAPETRS